MKKIIYASNGESDSHGFYDENGNIIRGWQSGDCLSFVFKDLFNHMGILMETKPMPEPDGDYPKKI